MQLKARSEQQDAVVHPLAELLKCSPEAGNLLDEAAQRVACDAGEVIFEQRGDCKGLYVVIAGEFLRKAERLKTRLSLGAVPSGQLVELAAALGDGHHTYTLTAQTPGSLLMLPIEGVRRAFESYPQLRMRLLEELAREVSRAYQMCDRFRHGCGRRALGGVALG
jgi:CRP-like cAMP-binding protein